MKPLTNHSGITPESFTTSRARADQGAGNEGVGSMGHGSLVVEIQDQVQSVERGSAIGLGR